MTSVRRRRRHYAEPGWLSPALALSKICWLFAVHFKPRVVTHRTSRFSHPRIKWCSRSFAPRFADSSSRQCAHLPPFVIAPLFYTFPLKSPIAILIIRLMYQKVSIVLENQQWSNRPMRETKGIFILYRYKNQGYYCWKITIKCTDSYA